MMLSYPNTVFTLMFLQCQAAAANSPKPRAVIREVVCLVWNEVRGTSG